MSHFYKNLKIVKERGMDIERYISPCITTQSVGTSNNPLNPPLLRGTNIEIFMAKSGDVTARCNGILLHSSHNPAKEGDKFALNSNIKEGDSVLLYGFGLGYHLDSILKAIGKKGNLLVLELNREILCAAFAYRDLSGMLSHPNLWIITGDTESEVSKAFSGYISKEWDCLPDDSKKVVIFSPSFKWMPEGFEGIKNAFNMLLTERRFPASLGDVEKRNFRLNGDAVLNSEGIKELFGKYKDMTGILVSSGPSLDIAIPELKALFSRPSSFVSRPSFFIMAVDSALHALMRNCIKPDFTISIDPQEFSYIHLADYFTTDVPLIFLPTSNPVVVKNYKGRKIVAIKNSPVTSHQSPVTSHQSPATSDKGLTDAGGSVSCIALDILIKLGANPIIFIGQDCSFPGNRFYSNAVGEAERWLEMVNGFYMMGDIHKDKIANQKTVYVTDRFGLKIPTHENLYRYIRYIEEIVKRENGISFYNLDSKGVGFRGVEDIPSLGMIKELWN